MPPLKSETPSRGGLLLFLILLALFLLKGFPPGHGTRTLPEAGPVRLQIRGDVKQPGTYAFKEPPTVRDALGIAGVSPSRGDLLPLGDGEPLPCGSCLRVQRTREGFRIERGEIPAFQKMTLEIPLSLNRETESGLTALPGIGPALAREIVLERERRGGFKRVEEIVNVRGIHRKTLARIRPFVTL